MCLATTLSQDTVTTVLDGCTKLWASQVDARVACRAGDCSRPVECKRLMQSHAVQKCIDLLEAEVAVVTAKLGAEHPLCKAVSNSARMGKEHKAVIDEWGRFPHRNKILGRESTEAEVAGLEAGTIASF